MLSVLVARRAREPPIWRSRQARRCRPWWALIWVICALQR